MFFRRNPTNSFRALLALGASSIAVHADIKVVQTTPSSVQLKRIDCRSGEYSIPAKEIMNWQCEAGWITLYIQNSGAAAKVAVTSEGRYPNGGKIPDLRVAASTTIKKNETKAIWAQISYRKPSTAAWYPTSTYMIQLEVAADDGGDIPAIALSPLTVQTAPSLSLGSLVLWGTLCTAVLVILCGIFSGRSKDLTWLKAPIGPPSFNPSTSMASMFAIAATILTSFLSFTGIPGMVSHLSRNSYTALSLVFAALILVAPVIFNSVRERVPVPNPDPNDLTNTSGFGFQGFLGMYALSTIVNLWGVLGQVGLILLLADELHLAEILAKPTVTTVHVTLIAILLLLIVYAVRTIRQQSDLSSTYAVAVAAHAAKAVVPDGVTLAVPPRAPKWTML
jgi:hypothetical protein